MYLYRKLIDNINHKTSIKILFSTHFFQNCDITSFCTTLLCVFSRILESVWNIWINSGEVYHAAEMVSEVSLDN